MIAIVDYNIGNVRSVQKAVERAARDAGLDVQVALTGDPGAILSAQGVILPGVGAFGACVTNLRQTHLSSVVREVAAENVPLLGICVGMQMLFEESEEMGRWRGLGLLPGRVRRFEVGLRVPQIGWNQLHIVKPDPLLEGVADGAYAYFVHSYYCDPANPDDILATTDYGIEYASVVRRDRIWGIQCHPEKSHQVGLQILRNFLLICEDE
ncbi:MAG: imidazole glycerol phosphate synthase subunit HisH [Chloroflexi bacterium]|nr:imidazole glycerol phosphate synthase subunit HisH [Chloroflexota bacterium]